MPEVVFKRQSRVSGLDSSESVIRILDLNHPRSQNKVSTGRANQRGSVKKRCLLKELRLPFWGFLQRLPSEHHPLAGCCFRLFRFPTTLPGLILVSLLSLRQLQSLLNRFQQPVLSLLSF